MATKDLFFKYNQEVHPIRCWFMSQIGVQFFERNLDQQQLHLFLMIWSHQSIQMTKNVENWIRRAGESCQQKGFAVIGQHLINHAKAEADHDQMLSEDSKNLIELWNQKYPIVISEHYLNQLSEKFQSGHSYEKLHEDVIASDTPFCQVAIEYEIERLSVVFAHRWIENVRFTLGTEFTQALTFLEEHALLDQGHTQFNRKLMEECFKATHSTDHLTTIAKQALLIYGNYLNECFHFTQNILDTQHGNQSRKNGMDLV